MDVLLGAGAKLPETRISHIPRLKPGDSQAYAAILKTRPLAEGPARPVDILPSCRMLRAALTLRCAMYPQAQ